jgi:hypothetical protein
VVAGSAVLTVTAGGLVAMQTSGPAFAACTSVVADSITAAG